MSRTAASIISGMPETNGSWTSPTAGGARARSIDLEGLNARLAGRVIDHTDNHGADRRIWSAALGERRDLYVYVPPGFDPGRAYPILVWLHGVFEDEATLIREGAL